VKPRVFKQHPLTALLKGVLPLLLAAAVVAVAMVGLRHARAHSRAESLRLLEDALRQVAVHSFAVNGYFPESLAYITQHYDIFIDHTQFIVHYRVFAPNVLPDIQVFHR